MHPEPFVIDVPQSVLDDLDQRLRRTRWPLDFLNDDWGYGANAAYLNELLDYWREGFDWRAQERAMNRYDHFWVEIDGVRIHFMHVRGKGPSPAPLIMSHGWPWTFWDLHKMIGPLTDPAAHGGDPADAFDLVIPSLPGFGFSTPLTSAVNFPRTADLWVRLMSEVLGYERFAAQGGDFGAMVTAQLGHKYADRLLGIHLHFVVPLTMVTGHAPAPEDYGPGEETWFADNQRFFADESAYSLLHRTKPQTLAYGLTDSPAALAAWLVEKRRTWSDSRGDVERQFSKDDLLTNVMIYWVTASGGSSARFYAEARRRPWTPSHDRTPVVEAPMGAAIFGRDIVKLPRRWAETYYDIRRWNVFDEGGHFAPMESPDILAHEIVEFFRPLRRAQGPA